MVKTVCLLSYIVALSSCAWVLSLGAAAPAEDCSTVVLSMADCLSFVTTGSTVVKPEGGCCAGLKTVLKTAPDCLCQTFKNSGQLGISLNMTKAVTLPSACGVKSPPLSACGLSVAPGASPAHSPKSSAAAPKSPRSSAPSLGPLPGEAPSSDASSGTTAPGPAKSGASTVSLSFIALVTMVAAGVYISYVLTY